VLKGNNDNVSSLRYFSGTYASIIDTTGDQNEHFNNGLAFGMKVGKPYGYNGVNGILLPVKTSGFIRATLSGSASFVPVISSVANMTASLSGVGTVNPAINAAYNMYCTLIGEANITPQLKAKAWMQAVMDAGARPSAFDIAQEVWQAQASRYNSTGTMGNKVNGAGSAGNPWTEVIEGRISASEALRLILSILMGKTTIVKGASGTATVTFKNVSDTKAKVVANMTGSNRTGVTINTD
jgi:hypothetical protein